MKKEHTHPVQDLKRNVGVVDDHKAEPHSNDRGARYVKDSRTDT